MSGREPRQPLEIAVPSKMATSTKPSAASPLDRLIEICCALPEAVCTRHGQHADFRVRKKVFAYYLDDHHGDGLVAVAFKAGRGENRRLIASDPRRFYLPEYIGPRGWAALCLDVEPVDWAQVSELVTASYRLCAPKSLVAKVDGAPGRARRT